MFLLLAFPQSSDELRGPSASRLSVEKAAIDFGTVPRDATRERKLLIRNRADRSVRLSDTESNCVCLSSEVGLEQLEAGQATEWRIVLNTCDYVGEVRRHVWLQAATPGSQRLKVSVRYRVVPELFTEPEFLPLGLIGDEPVECTLEIRTVADGPFYLGRAACDDPQVEVTVEEPTVTSAEPGRIRVLVYPPIPKGRFRPTITLDTTSAAVPLLRVPVYGESIVGIACDRREVVFDGVPLGASRTRQVTLTPAPEMRVRAIRVSNQSLEVAQIQRGADRIVLTLRNSSKLPLGAFRGFLILEVDNGQGRKIKLPFRGRVIEAERARRLGHPHASSTRTSQ
jgi:hypothetical protein